MDWQAAQARPSLDKKGRHGVDETSSGGAKRETKLRVDDELYRFYQSLPKDVRSKLLERAIRTLIKNA